MSVVLINLDTLCRCVVDLAKVTTYTEIDPVSPFCEYRRAVSAVLSLHLSSSLDEVLEVGNYLIIVDTFVATGILVYQESQVIKFLVDRTNVGNGKIQSGVY